MSEPTACTMVLRAAFILSRPASGNRKAASLTAGARKGNRNIRGAQAEKLKAAQQSMQRSNNTPGQSY